MNVMSLRRALDGILAGDFSDPTNERLIYLSAAGLAVLGLGLLVGTLIWWRRGRQEHPALAPLEVMSGRAWVNAPEGDRRRRLDQVRLSGAAGTVGERIVADPVDLEALVSGVPDAFDDLREPSPVVAVPAAAEVVADDSAAEVESAAVDSESQPAVEVESAEGDGVVESAEEPEAEPAPPEPDATSVSTERPVVPAEPLEKVPVDSTDSSSVT